ncbi:TonB-dependent receptor plug domain-containing protein [Pseudomonas chlororaphis]|uniref:Ligand-gated channel n=1 Tax=Pseudomonas chlororaphis TaxID=587753 RepID=A0A0D5XY37_9PSED|nr:TonB-dependent receptor [Pseudomonas chlororaphis]AKA23996.1 ligand-gated channel [Pseudomonas chlororaphis]
MLKRSTARRTAPACGPLLLPLSIACSLASLNLEAADSASPTLGTVVVTGNRGTAERTVTTSPTPIDVVTGEQLRAVGKPSLLEALSKFIPSFNLPDRAGWDASGVVRSPTLRGLTASHVLVLVNGKRRHTSATLNINGINSGAAPSDLDLIPVAAIDHIEVLRDGAAAQYGSDAISGVINIILKQTTGGSSDTTLGQGYDGKRGTAQEALNYGFQVGEAGVLNVSLDTRYQERDNKAGSNGYSNHYYPQADGSPDPREAGASHHTYKGYGLPRSQLADVGYNLDLPLGDDLTLYSFSTLATRENNDGQNFRLPNGRNTITTGPNGYPDGYSPYWLVNETDFQSAFGARGEAFDGWAWDLSSTYGRNYAKQRTYDNQNPSLGENTPNKFTSGIYIADQLTSNLDLKNSYDIGLAKPLDVAFGFEHRRESYETRAGSEASYIDGGYVFPTGHPRAGQRPDPGAQVTNGISPEDAQKISRNSVASYIDLGFYPVEQWYVGLAARYEHYNEGVGATRSGKLSTRYEFNPLFSVRGTLSNGFRAPSLANQIFTARSTGFDTINGVYQSYNYVILPVDSAGAQALGAQSLKPERSTNFSLGFALTPSDDLSLTVDGYVINLRDRLVLSERFQGPGVAALLDSIGVPATAGAQYFTNGADTRTSGVDVVGNYRQDLARYGTVKWTAALNYNHTQILSVNDTPAQLSALGSGFQLLGRQSRALISKTTPSSKMIFSADWAIQDFDVNLRLTRYGTYTEVNSSSDPSLDRDYSAKWITDLDVAYNVDKQLTVAVGAQNLFDKYPDHIGVSNSSFGDNWGSYSPFGFTGGYYYTRLQYAF